MHTWVKTEEPLPADTVYFVCTVCGTEKRTGFGMTDYWSGNRRSLHEPECEAPEPLETP